MLPAASVPPHNHHFLFDSLLDHRVQVGAPRQVQHRLSTHRLRLDLEFAATLESKCHLC